MKNSYFYRVDLKKFFTLLLIPLILTHIILGLMIHTTAETAENLNDEYQFIQAGRGVDWYKNEGLVVIIRSLFNLNFDVTLTRILFGIISSLSIIPAYYFFREFTKDEVILRTGVLFYGYNPFLLYYGTRILTEAWSYLFLPIILVLGMKFIRKKTPLNGFLFGISSLFFSIRHTTTIFGFLLIGLIWLLGSERKIPSMKSLSTLTLGGILGITPYLVFSQIVYGNPIHSVWTLFYEDNIAQVIVKTIYVPTFIVLSWILLPLVLFYFYKLYCDLKLRKTYLGLSIAVIIWIIVQELIFFKGYALFDHIRLVSISWITLSMFGAIGFSELLNNQRVKIFRRGWIITWGIICYMTLTIVFALLLMYFRFFSFDLLLWLNIAV